MASTETERLITRLEATHREYARDMQRAQAAAAKQLARIDAKVSKTSRGFSRFGKAAAGAMAGILTGAAARQLVRGIESAVDKLDDIAKTADGIGLTTDALQELRVAADLSGVDPAALDTSLRRLVRTASDAKNGLSTAVRAFDAVGVSVENADGSIKSIDVLVLEIAAGMAKMTDFTQRGATSLELFGRSGLVMVNLLKDGPEAILRYMAKARELGIVIDEELIRRSVKAKDELTLLTKVIGTKMTVALAEFAPHLASMAGLLADIVTATSRAADGMRTFAKSVTEGFLRARSDRLIAEKKDEIAAVNRLFDEATAKQVGRGRPAELSASQIPKVGPEIFESLGRRNLKLERLNAELGDLVAARQRLEDAIVTLNEPVDSGGDGGGGGGGGGGLPAIGLPAKTTPKSFTTAALADLAEQASAMELRIRLIGATTRETARLTAEERILAKARREGIQLTDEQRANIALFADDIGVLAEMEAELRVATEAAADATDEQAQSAMDARRAMADMFTDAIGQAQNLESALISLGQRLAELAVKGLFGQGPLGGSGGLGGIFGSIAKAVIGGAGGAGGSAFTGLRPGREHGGPVQAGRAFIVGEKRPELFVPNTSGVIVPRVPQGGGPTINVTIENNFALGVTPTVRAEIAAATPGIVAAAKAGVAEAAQRGGAFAKGLRG